MKHIFHNGVFFTGSKVTTDAKAVQNIEALAVESGKIIKTGSKKEIEKWADETTEWHDLKGRFVVPGFNDSHMHLLNYGRTLRLADLAEATSSLNEMVEALNKYQETTKSNPESWIVGWGWNHKGDETAGRRLL